MPELIRDILGEYGHRYLKHERLLPSISYTGRSRFEISRTNKAKEQVPQNAK